MGGLAVASCLPSAASWTSAAQRVTANLFLKMESSEGRRMLIIVAGLTIALVAADLLDLSSRKTPGDRDRARLGRS